MIGYRRRRIDARQAALPTLRDGGDPKQGASTRRVSVNESDPPPRSRGLGLSARILVRATRVIELRKSYIANQHVREYGRLYHNLSDML